MGRSGSGDDPFAKVKGLIADMIEKLESEAEADATHKAYCDKELAESREKKADMEQGLEGVKVALRVLNDYYAKSDKAHEAAEGAGHGIIGLLEVIESDFSKALAEFISVEETAAADYDKQSKENEIEKTTKDQDVKYKNAEASDLDKATAEASSD